MCQMYGFGYPRLSLHLGEEEGGWEYSANGWGVHPLSVSGRQWLFERADIVHLSD